MKVRELVSLLLDCDPELDVVDHHYRDSYSVKEETVRHIRNNGDKTSASHLILEFSEE